MPLFSCGLSTLFIRIYGYGLTSELDLRDAVSACLHQLYRQLQ